jgi:hypothetical protein
MNAPPPVLVTSASKRQSKAQAVAIETEDDDEAAEAESDNTEERQKLLRLRWLSALIVSPHALVAQWHRCLFGSLLGTTCCAERERERCAKLLRCAAHVPGYRLPQWLP